jgi:hypothetical protein
MGGRRRVYAAHAPETAGPCRHRPETLNAPAPTSSTDNPKISPAVLIHGAEEAGAEGPQSGGHRRRRRHETAESDMGLSTNRAADRLASVRRTTHWHDSTGMRGPHPLLDSRRSGDEALRVPALLQRSSRPCGAGGAPPESVLTEPAWNPYCELFSSFRHPLLLTIGNSPPTRQNLNKAVTRKFCGAWKLPRAVAVPNVVRAV